MYAQHRCQNHQIKSQNHRGKQKPEKKDITCNFRIRTSCPVEGKYLSKSVIFKATVTYYNKEQHYIGSTVRNFKIRYNGNMHSFRNKNLKESKQLSSFIQAAKFNENMIKNNVKLKIKHKTNQSKQSRICTLCNIERLEVEFADKNSPLNSRTELLANADTLLNFI